MALLGHMFLMLIGFAVASFAAAAVLSFGLTSPLWGAALTGYAPQGLWVTTWILSFVVAALAFLPSLILMVVGESFRLRSILFYGLGGALIGVLYSPIGTGAARWWIEFDRDVITPRPVELLVASGIAAGLVYWAIAGRSAGKWRASPPSP